MDALFRLTILISVVGVINSDFLNDKCEASGWSCYDCYTRKLCWGTSLWDKSSCLTGVTNNQEAYCDPKSNKCVSWQPTGCASTSHFKCIREDVFPDIQNCTKYFTCKGDEVETFVCNATQYYKPSWGKCVFRVSQEDCKSVECGLSASVDLVEDDHSLYYECKSNNPTLKGCAKSTEVYDVGKKECHSVCSKSTLGFIANTKDCTKYYSCNLDNSTYTLKELKCPKGQGFNKISKLCEAKYDKLCNELELLENDIELVISKIPFAPTISQIIKGIFRLFKYNPLRLIFIFGLKEDTYNMAIMIFDYAIINRGIPPAIIDNLVREILKFLPEPLARIIEAILKFIPRLPSLTSFFTTREKRSLGSHEAKLAPLFDLVLRNLYFNFEALESRSKFSSALPAIGNHLVDILEVPEENVEEILHVIRDNLNEVVELVNADFGSEIFDYHDGVFNVNREFVENALSFFVRRVYDHLEGSEPGLLKVLKFYDAESRGKFVIDRLDGLRI